MSPAEEEAKEKASVGGRGGGELMDVDFDLDLDDPTSWPFDPLAMISSPPSPYLPAAASPIWLVEDGLNSIGESSSSVLVVGNSVTTNRNVNRHDSYARLFRLPSEDQSSDGSCMIKERMSQALRFFKDSTDQHLLVQVWAPIKNGNRYVLTTSGQPFVLGTRTTGLVNYRTVSMMYMFSADGDGDGDLGLPGRVFRQKVPEWTPNVEYYSSKEYPRRSHALNYNVQGTLALPVFEPSGHSCVGVVELIMTSQKINYAAEVDKVCKALEAVNLKSSEILDHPNVLICNEGRQIALAEILETLTMVCENYKLPLAQTWVPCRHRSVLAHGGGSKKSCFSFDGSCMGQVCLSTTDAAFYVIDAHMWGFREACVEHHLQKGQGTAGKAFQSRRPFLSSDITQFCKTEYPLVHYARMFKLAGCFAVCVQSTYTGNDDYILEFFLPPDCRKASEQQAFLQSVTSEMKQHFHSLKIITDVVREEELCIDFIDTFDVTNREPEPGLIHIQGCENQFHDSPETKHHEDSNDLQNEEKAVSDLLPQQLLEDADAGKDGNVDSNGSGNSGSLVNKNNRPLQRRRGKAEKTISLEVLQQYFAGGLKEAARSLGVCPTTMKRICRQHGISRWPSRKINKVNRSLSKLKTVIESVRGAEGGFDLTSISSPFPVAVASFPVNLDEYKWKIGAKPPILHDGRGKDSSHKSPNSDDQRNKLIVQQEFAHDHTGIQHEPSNVSNSSSGEGSMKPPTSEGSCQGSPVNGTRVGNQCVSSILETRVNNCESFSYPKPVAQDPNSLPVFSVPDAIMVEAPTAFGGILIEDSRSSKDLKDLGTCAAKDRHDERIMDPPNNPSQRMPTQDLRTVTIKASYKEDIIRFRLPCTADVGILRKEVAQRLKLEVGTFDVRYLDDDHEWVMLACNADLVECMDISKLSGGHVIRLSVNDSGRRSSCESSDR